MKKLIAGVLAGLVLATGAAVIAQNVVDVPGNQIIRVFDPYIRYQGSLSFQNAAGTAQAKATQTGFQVGASGTVLTQVKRYQSAVSVATVAANTTAGQTLTVTGVVSGEMCVGVTKPTEQAGLGIVGCRVPSNGTNNAIVVTFSNNTGAVITPTTPQTYDFYVVSGT